MPPHMVSLAFIVNVDVSSLYVPEKVLFATKSAILIKFTVRFADTTSIKTMYINPLFCEVAPYMRNDVYVFLLSLIFIEYVERFRVSMKTLLFNLQNCNFESKITCRISDKTNGPVLSSFCSTYSTSYSILPSHSIF